jgi:hypothetical protein
MEMVLLYPDLQSLLYVPWRGFPGAYGIFIFSFLKNLNHFP